MKKKVIKLYTNFLPTKDLKNQKILGLWCKKNLKNIKEIEKIISEKKIFYNQKIDVERAYKCCEQQHLRILNNFSNYLKKINKNKFSNNFYKNFTFNWLYYFIHFCHYAKRYAELYKKELKNFRVILINQNSLIDLRPENLFSASHNFFWNEEYFSIFVTKFLKEDLPKNWTLKTLGSKKNRCHVKFKVSLISKIKKKVLNFFFPNIFSVYGLSLIDKIYFTLKIKLRNKKNKFKKKDISITVKQRKTYSKPPIDDKEMLNLAKKFLPKSFENIHKFTEIKKDFSSDLLLCSASALTADEKDMYKIFSFKENGGKVISVQHGGSYRDLNYIRHIIELKMDYFISWGGEKHFNYNKKFTPLPSPQLKQPKMNLKKKSNILFVSKTPMVFAPKYFCSTNLIDTYNRLCLTINLLKNLNKKTFNKIIFRSHNEGHFSEKKLLNAEVKNLKFSKNFPEDDILYSKLVLMNNYSTFFFKSLAWNVPTVLLTKINCWKLSPDARKMHIKLKKVGIIHEDPVKAAKFLNNFENKLSNWWYQDELQKVRKMFCKNYAQSDINWKSQWAKFLLKI